MKNLLTLIDSRNHQIVNCNGEHRASYLLRLKKNALVSLAAKKDGGYDPGFYATFTKVELVYLILLIENFIWTKGLTEKASLW